VNPQLVSTLFAWAIAVILLVVAASVIRRRQNIDWWASAAFAVGALCLAIAALVSATSVLFSGAIVPDAGRWTIIITRAIAVVLLLGVAMDMVGRPRWLLRLVERLTGK